MYKEILVMVANVVVTTNLEYVDSKTTLNDYLILEVR